MFHATQVIKINAPIDVIWQVISDFGAGARYLVMVTHCTMQGNGVGALRILTYVDGSVILERLETVDQAMHCLSYRLLNDTPFGNCLTTMALRALTADQSEVNWSANFQPTSLPADEALSLMQGMLAENCQALKQLMER